MAEHQASRRARRWEAALLVAVFSLGSAAFALAARPARPVHRHHHHRAPTRYRGVHVEVGAVYGPHSTIVVRVHERQPIIYTVRLLGPPDRYTCTAGDEKQARGRAGHVATFRFRPPVGERWCAARWSVRVLHVTYGPDPCHGDEICRDSPPEYDRLLGGGHFLVRRR